MGVFMERASALFFFGSEKRERLSCSEEKDSLSTPTLKHFQDG